MHLEINTCISDAIALCSAPFSEHFDREAYRGISGQDLQAPPALSLCLHPATLPNTTHSHKSPTHPPGCLLPQYLCSSCPSALPSLDQHDSYLALILSRITRNPSSIHQAGKVLSLCASVCTSRPPLPSSTCDFLVVCPSLYPLPNLQTMNLSRIQALS